ncbi:Gfo/Idh/MocA family protein [Pelagovum pacificum]|uniref:Gfo/Idh/MocA family oxidoreductase n=1 Tax=Pelagovum pacificum TaxID=2588711 RepID=A0A5C5GEW1_9RHOB|nr:Gfo/Idh/MocA family oxidoreductase [Pelagovum pacificum]QQA43820.1 Gfo/Idh/MocA family oxidoreductase [Pelagovum pacificum]TNY33050.1 Gfo/Idh/MocA family oxidoreductase [Pelagovum pacificum]
MRAVMVGCGAMSNGWLKAIRETPALNERVDMVGFVDLDETAAKRQASEYGYTSAVTGSDLEAVIAEAKPDAVFDLVIPGARRKVAAQALNAGCHVLSEKPMANTLPEAKELLQIAQDAGKMHVIIQNRRHLPGIRRLKDVIESGAIGELTALHADFYIGAHFGGFREEMDHVLLLDMAIHTFDAARFLMPSEPVGVYCQETNPEGSWYKHGAAANALFDNADGSVFTYRGSWVAEGANTSWESSWRAIGTKGTALWDGSTDGLSANVTTSATDFMPAVEPVALPDPKTLPAEAHAGVILDFVEAVETGRTALTANTDNIKSLAMVFAAIDSAETGARVKLDI